MGEVWRLCQDEHWQHSAGIVVACLVPLLDGMQQVGSLLLTCRSACHHILASKGMVGKLLKAVKGHTVNADTAHAILRMPNSQAHWLLEAADKHTYAGLSPGDLALAGLRVACTQRDASQLHARLKALELEQFHCGATGARASSAIVNTLDVQRGTLLQLVISKLHPANRQLVSLLLEAGADVNALILLMQWLVDQPDVLRLLLEHGADMSCMTTSAEDPSHGLSALHRAVLQFLGPSDQCLPGLGYVTTPHRPSRNMEEACQDALDICRMLTQHGADVNATCTGEYHKGCTPLQLASQAQQLPWVRALLVCGACVSVPNARSGYYALHFAFTQALNKVLPEGNEAVQLAVMEALLDAGANLNQHVGVENITALHYACIFKQPSIVQLLLDRGANVHAKGVLDVTPLFQATESACSASVKLLLAQGAKARAMSAGLSMLHNMARKVLPAAWGSEADEVVELLLAAGLPVDVTDSDGCTPLQTAASLGHLPMVQVLLSNRARVGKASFHRTALVFAVVSPFTKVIVGGAQRCVTQAERLAVMAALLEAGADPNAPVHAGGSLLHLVLATVDEAAIRLLLKHGANAMATNAGGETPLHLLCKLTPECEDAWQAVEPLVTAAPACLHAKSKLRQTPLAVAVSGMKLHIARELLRLGANVNDLIGRQRHSPLHAACMAVMAASTGDGADVLFPEPAVLAMVQLLLEYGADVNRVVESPREDESALLFTPLHLAAKAGYADVTAALVAAGADAFSLHGSELLSITLGFGHAAVLRVLLTQSAAKVYAVDIAHACGLLHKACWQGQPACLEVLLDVGADPRVSWQDYTPLQLVAQRKQPSAQLLELLGAPPTRSSEAMRQVVAMLVQALKDWNSGSKGSSSSKGSGAIEGQIVSVSKEQEADVSAATQVQHLHALPIEMDGAIHASAGQAVEPEQLPAMPSLAVATHGSGSGAQSRDMLPAAASIANPPDKVCSQCGAVSGSSRPAAAAQECAAGTSAAGSIGQKGERIVKLKLCKGCASVRYCSEQCQTAGWNGGHKKECKRLKAAKAAQQAQS